MKQPKTCVECREVIEGKVRRGRCEKCYRAHLQRLKKDGEYQPLVTPAILRHPGELVLEQVDKVPGGCWLYTGALTSRGYGERVANALQKGKRVWPHRAVYEYLVGPIPNGLELDHTCHTSDKQCPGGPACQHRRCVNPDHLEPVTGVVNNDRSNSPTSINVKKTHCMRGHEFTPENTLWRPLRNGQSKPSRQCRECRRLLRRRKRSAG